MTYITRPRLSFFLILPLLTLLIGCDPETDPDDPAGADSIAVVMTKVANLPSAGGDATGVAIGQDNMVYAVIDGDLYRTDPTGGAPQLINGDANHWKVAVGSTGDIYTTTALDFRTYASGSSTPTVVPFDPAGPLATNGSVQDAKIIISPSGVPFVILVSNYPRTYIYYSNDRGASWTPLDLPNGAASFGHIGDITFTGSGVLIAGNYEGLHRSTDLGVTWTRLNSSMPNSAIKLMTAPNGDIYRYTHGGGGLDVSHDGGISFIPLTPFNQAPFFTQVVSGNTGALYALANSSSAGGGTPIARPMSFYRSTDGGATWHRRFPGQMHEFAMRGSRVVLGMAGEPHGFKPGGVAISDNLGKTWRSAGIGTADMIESFSFDTEGNLLIRADGGLFRQTSTGWEMFGSPWGTAPLASSSTGGIIVAATGESLFSDDQGESWRTIQTVGGNVLVLKNGGFLVYGPSGIDRVSSTGEVTSLNRTLGLERMLEDAAGILYGSYQYLDGITSQYINVPYRSTDGGATWLEVETDTPAIAFNSLNNLLAYGELSSYSYGGAESSSRKKISFSGFSVPPNLIEQAMFDRTDRLWMLAMEGDLYASSAPLK